MSLTIDICLAPGEEVRVEGWIRIAAGGLRATFEAWLARSGRSPTASLTAATRDRTRTRPVGALGGFDFAVNLPGTMTLGRPRSPLAPTPQSLLAVGRHRFMVQEFRRPSSSPGATAVDVTLSDSRGWLVAAGEVRSSSWTRPCWPCRRTDTSYPVAQFDSRRGEGTRDYHIARRRDSGEGGAARDHRGGLRCGWRVGVSSLGSGPRARPVPMGEAEGAAGGAVRRGSTRSPRLFVPDVWMTLTAARWWQSPCPTRCHATGSWRWPR